MADPKLIVTHLIRTAIAHRFRGRNLQVLLNIYNMLYTNNTMVYTI